MPKKLQQREDDFLSPLEDNGDTAEILDVSASTEEVLGIPVVGKISEMDSHSILSFPVSTTPGIFPTGVILNEVRRTPEQDVTSTFSKNYVPFSERQV